MLWRRPVTLAQAQRQVRWRSVIGWGFWLLAVVVWLLFTAKFLYLNAVPPLQSLGMLSARDDPRPVVDAFLRTWPPLNLLWRAVPPWESFDPVAITPHWDYVYAIAIVAAMGFVAARLLRSASRRQAEITKYYQDRQHAVWQEQDRTARGLAPADRGSTTVIGQAIWHEYLIPPEPWSQTTRGVLALGLIVAVVSGGILLYAEYQFFQAYWPLGRN